MYQRRKIQKESMHYEHKKPGKSLSQAGVNIFVTIKHAAEIATSIELIRFTEEGKGQHISNVCNWQLACNALVPSGKNTHLNMADDYDGVETESPDRHGLGYLQPTARD